MSLFGDLPPPSAQAQERKDDEDIDKKLERLKRAAQREVQLEAPDAAALAAYYGTTAGALAGTSATPGQQGDVSGEDVADQEVQLEGPVKRRRVGFDDHAEASDARQRSSDAGTSSAEAQAKTDQVTAALKKIASHIGNASKFVKASGLLRQLLDSGTLNRTHRVPCLEAIKAAFAVPEGWSNVTEPTLRREYMKLASSFSTRAQEDQQLFGRLERGQLEVYRMLAFTQNELATDDSFVFNKVLTSIRELFDGLPDATPDEDEALANLATGGGSSSPSAAGQQQQQDDDEQQQQQQEQEQAVAPAASIEEDPFGLDQLMALPAKRHARTDSKPKPDKPTSTAWSPVEALAMKRRALLDCVQTAKKYHKNAWARTGVELLIEHVHTNRQRMCATWQEEVEELMRFVRLQRALRKKGPSAKEINRDSTAFERARAEWSKAGWISTRGKVGAQGDAKSTAWLG